jgi:hypothetical protein
LLLRPGASVSNLDPTVLAEIQRVLPRGHRLPAGSRVRIAGTDQYGTAVDIARPSGNRPVFEVYGLNQADTLSPGPAGTGGLPESRERTITCRSDTEAPVNTL